MTPAIYEILAKLTESIAVRDAAIAEIVAQGREIILPYFREHQLSFRHNDGDWFVCDAKGNVHPEAVLPDYVNEVLLMELGKGSHDYLGDHLKDITSIDWEPCRWCKSSECSPATSPQCYCLDCEAPLYPCRCRQDCPGGECRRKGCVNDATADEQPHA